MLVIADSRMPDAAKKHLQKLPNRSGSNHKQAFTNPFQDIRTFSFATQNPDWLPLRDFHNFILKNFRKKNVNVTKGSTPVGSKYPQTAIYNAVATHDYLIHHIKHTAPEIKNQI